MEGKGLAAQAIALLVPYLTAAGQAVAARVGVGLWDQFRGAASKLFARVKEKFATDAQATDDLSMLEKDPNSRGRQTVVQELLSGFLESDPQFANELGELVKAARQAGGDTITQAVNVSGGTVGDITQIGKIESRD